MKRSREKKRVTKVRQRTQFRDCWKRKSTALMVPAGGGSGLERCILRKCRVTEYSRDKNKRKITKGMMDGGIEKESIEKTKRKDKKKSKNQ